MAAAREAEGKKLWGKIEVLQGEQELGSSTMYSFEIWKPSVTFQRGILLRNISMY